MKRAAFFSALPLIGTIAAAANQAPQTPNVLTPSEIAAGWELLFDGKSIEDWKASDSPGTFSVRDGEIIVHGPRSHLFYLGPIHQHKFKNFELQADVLTRRGANSGIYFHTTWQPTGWPNDGFEVQVNNSHSDPKRTAALYDVKDNYAAVASDDEWFTMNIRVEGNHVVTRVNGNLIVDYIEAADWSAPKDHPGRRIASGTFALQGHDPASETHFRNIKVRVLP